MTFHTKHFVTRSTTLPHLTWLLLPQPDESLAGFIGRICSHNALRRPQVVIADVGLRPKNGYGAIARASGSIASLASVLAVDADWIECRRHQPVGRTFINFHGATLRRAHMDYAVRHVSPSAIRDDPFHRELWHIRTLAACPATAELLVDRCQEASCGKFFDWNETRGVGRCSNVDCAGNLEDLVADQVLGPLLPGLRRAAGLIDPDLSEQTAAMNDLPECLKTENRGDLFELAWLLGCIDHPLGVPLRVTLPLADPLKGVRPSLREPIASANGPHPFGAFYKLLCKPIATVWSYNASWATFAISFEGPKATVVPPI